MLTRLLQLLNDDAITVDELHIRFTGLFRYTLEVTYTKKATLIQQTSNLKYSHYDLACQARDKLESLTVY